MPVSVVNENYVFQEMNQISSLFRALMVYPIHIMQLYYVSSTCTYTSIFVLCHVLYIQSILTFFFVTCCVTELSSRQTVLEPRLVSWLKKSFRVLGCNTGSFHMTAGVAFRLFNDFAHIPWEGTPDFPKPPQRKKFLQKLLVKGKGYLLGVCG